VKFVNRVFLEVAPELMDLIGVTRGNAILTEAGLEVMDSLNRDRERRPDFDLALSQLYAQLAFAQAWWGGNTSGDFLEATRVEDEGVQGREAVGTIQPAFWAVSGCGYQ